MPAHPANGALNSVCSQETAAYRACPLSGFYFRPDALVEGGFDLRPARQGRRFGFYPLPHGDNCGTTINQHDELEKNS